MVHGRAPTLSASNDEDEHKMVKGLKRVLEVCMEERHDLQTKTEVTKVKEGF